MKKTNIILAAIALLLTVSCSRKIDFVHETFITFENTSYSVSEGAGTMTIPVSIYNPTGSRIQVAVAAIDGEGENGALAGADYEVISPAAGVLTFEGDENTKNIEIALKPVKGLTGTKNFTVQISSLTRGVHVGGYDLASIRIMDDDHPLAPFIGRWTGTLMEMTTGLNYETEINIEAVEGNYSKLRLDSGIDPVYGKGLKVKYSATVDNVKNPTRIDIQSRQLSGYENFFISGLEETAQGLNFSDNITFGLNSDGTLSLANMYGVIVPNEAGGGYALAAVYFAVVPFVKK